MKGSREVREALSLTPQEYILANFPSVQKGFASLQSNTTSADSPSTEPGDWKLELLTKFETTHHGRLPEFNKLIDDYIFEDVTKDAKPDRSPLLRGCSAYGEAKVLEAIWKHEGVKSWSIEGPVELHEWETWIKSGQNGIPVEALRLQKMNFDASTGAMLFKVLKLMPKLNSLILDNTGIETGAFLFNMLDCPALDKLKTVEVIALDASFDVCPLLLKILGACQLQRLSIEECASITVDQHTHLAKALGQQARLSCLKLEISTCNTPEQFKCYVQFLRNNASLTELDLSGCDLGILNCNSLLEALRSKPALTKLSLRDCQLMNDPDERIQILPVADMPGLRELDLADNYLADDTMMPLLVKLQGTCLSQLDLSGNNIKLQTIEAVCSLLKANNTLLWLSLDRDNLRPRAYVEKHLAPLVDALEDNTSLLRLDIGRPVEDATRKRLGALLARNRQIFAAAAMKSGMRALVLERAKLSFPNELVTHVFEQGLTRRDALSLSSVNLTASRLRQQLSRTGGSSK